MPKDSEIGAKKIVDKESEIGAGNAPNSEQSVTHVDPAGSVPSDTKLPAIGIRVPLVSTICCFAWLKASGVCLKHASEMLELARHMRYW